MIRSGRTKSVSDELKKWYDQEYKNADTVWIWGCNREALQSLLDTREPVPFRCFLIRYLLEIHKEELRKAFASVPLGKGWADKCADLLLEQIGAGKGETYETASRELKALTDVVYADFRSNLGALPGEVSGKKRKKIWSRNQILSKIRADNISAGELWTLGFGLNMDREDLSFFLKKALKREDFNLWNYKEFLLYLAFQYGQGSRFVFYGRLQEAFGKARPVACGWTGTEGPSTAFIRNKAELAAEKMGRQCADPELDQEGELPDRIVRLLGEYKYLTGYTEDYTRTVQREGARLLGEFKKRIDSELIAIKETWKGDAPKTGRISQGKVLVYYDPGKGLDIPRGTLFYKKKASGKGASRGSGDGGRVGFAAEQDTVIAPVEDALRAVKIPVRCVKKTRKRRRREEEYGYVQGNTEFSCANPYLRNIRNKSQFKTPAKVKGRKIAEGELTCVAGTLYAECTAGKMIPRGTEFRPQGEAYDQAVFVSVEDVSAETYEEIWVHCTEPECEATLNEISDCSIPDWRTSLVHIGNKKIGFNKKKEEDAAKESVLYKYLYPAFDEFYQLSDVLDRRYLGKLGAVLEGTQLSSAKLSQIRTQKAEGITRNDILTLSFLDYMSEIEEQRRDRDYEPESEDDYKYRRTGFIQRTNEVLARCGFYEMYAPNPYDSLLICLLSSNEAIEAYRNLWGWYLANRDQRENGSKN